MRTWTVPGWDEAGNEIYVRLQDGDLVPEGVLLCPPFRNAVVDGRWMEPPPPRPWIVGDRREEIRDGLKWIREERLHPSTGGVITSSWTEPL